MLKGCVDHGIEDCPNCRQWMALMEAEMTDAEARIRADERARIAAFVRSPEADDLLHAAEQQPGWMNLAAAADGTYIDARTVLADAIEHDNYGREVAAESGTP